MLSSPCSSARRSLVDGFRRHITYLRVSITDRCNLRCVYCMPAGGALWKPRDEILSYEEIIKVVRVAQQQGVRKVRVTGGEPLVRHGCADLIAMLAELGLAEICLTTNGIRFAEQAATLRDNGLSRVNISLDTLNPERFRAITRGGELARVLEAIDAALDLGLQPRINIVAMRGFNDDELPALAALTMDRPLTVRFIEVMPFTGEADERLRTTAPKPVDCESREVEPLPLEEVRAALGLPAVLELSTAGELPVLNTLGPAEYTRLPGAVGEVGFIASMHQHICERCNRVRLTA
ncbi:MAG: GTP 3',8-cyclase MoaA, partial [Armatimonadetes bacterium]|nr:GTP 3',8-cyclase MoaA [Armatimonadota bacterium]